MKKTRWVDEDELQSLQLKSSFRAMAKKQMGGDSGDGMDQDDFLGNMTRTFTDKLKSNTAPFIADEAAQQFQGMFAQMGMAMEDYGYNPNMNNNQMYQDKYNFMQNQQQNAGQNFMDQSMNMLNQMAGGGTGGGPQKGQSYEDWTVSQGRTVGFAPDDRTWDGEKWTGKIKPDFTQNDDAEYQKQKAFLDRYYKEQGNPTPSYQSQWNTNQGRRYFPANTNNQGKWNFQGKAPGIDGSIKQVDITPEYGALDRFITGFRKDKNKHTFGPKKITYSFRTYTDPNTGEKKQVSVPSGDSQMNTANTNINSDQSNYVTHPDYAGPSKYDSENENYQELGDRIKAGEYNNALQNNVIESMEGFNPLPDYMSSQKRYGGLPKAQAGAFNPACTDEEKANPNSPCYTPDFVGFAQGKTENLSPSYNPNGNFYDSQAVWKRGFGNMAGEDKANWLMSGTEFLTAGLNSRENQATKNQMMKNTLADNQFMTNSQDNMGDYNWSGMSDGMFRPNQYGVIQQPGNNFGGGYGKFGGPQYQDGGEYSLTDDEIQEIYARGGSVEFLD